MSVGVDWGRSTMIKRVLDGHSARQRRDEKIWIPSRENVVTATDPDMVLRVNGGGAATYITNSDEQYVLRLDAGGALGAWSLFNYNPISGNGTTWYDGHLRSSRSCLVDYKINVPVIGTPGEYLSLRLSSSWPPPDNRDCFLFHYDQDSFGLNWRILIVQNGVAMSDVVSSKQIVAGKQWLRLQIVAGERMTAYVSRDGNFWTNIYEYRTPAGFPLLGMGARGSSHNMQAGANTLLELLEIHTSQDFV